MNIQRLLELEIIEEHFNDYAISRREQLYRTKELIELWYKSIDEQQIYDVNHKLFNNEEPIIIPEMIEYHAERISPNWQRIKNGKDSIIVDYIEINNKLYPLYIAGGQYNKMFNRYNGLNMLLSENGCNPEDRNWFYTKRDYYEILCRAEEDKDNYIKKFKNKVRRLIGKEFELDIFDGDIYLFGEDKNLRIHEINNKLIVEEVKNYEI